MPADTIHRPRLPSAEATPPASDKEIADIQAEVANNLFGAVLPEPAAQAEHRGFATWVSDENGNTTFTWKEPKP